MERATKNGGMVTEKMSNGSRWMDAYGKDDSDVAGSAKMERGPHKMGGSITNLAHSLSGTSANQKGR